VSLGLLREFPKYVFEIWAWFFGFDLARHVDEALRLLGIVG
jgi:hypothetical protein